MKEVLDKLINNGYDSYIVGGYVRDFLLGIKSYDIDITTSASIEEIKNIFGNIGVCFDKYYSYHFKNGWYDYTITSYRKELSYKNNKPIKIKPCSSVSEDLLRRDFTINAILMDNDGNIIDPNNYISDLNNRLIKVIGKTNIRLNEDKTRVLRAIRLSILLDFELDKEIIEYIANNKSTLFDNVEEKYIVFELDKIFNSKNYMKFFSFIEEYDLKESFKIDYDIIKKSNNSYEVWNQIRTSLPLTKKIKSKISSIKF